MDTGLTNGTKYTYLIKAVENGTESDGIELNGTFDMTGQSFTANLDISAVQADDEGNISERFEVSSLSGLRHFDTDKLYAEADGEVIQLSANGDPTYHIYAEIDLDADTYNLTLTDLKTNTEYDVISGCKKC